MRGHLLLVPLLGLACLLPPEDAAARASALYRARKFSDAARLLEAHLAAHPSDFSSRLLLGLSYQLAEDRPRAEAVFARAAEQNPQHGRARFFLARIRFLRGNFEAAERDAAAALRLGEPAAQVHVLQGMIRAEQGRLEDALSLFRKAMPSAAPGDPNPWIQAGIVLLKAARYEEARRSLETAVGRNGSSAEALYHLARAHLELRQTEAAQAALSRAAKLGHEPSERLLRQVRSGGAGGAGKRRAAEQVSPIEFRDIAASAGLRFALENSPTPRKHIVETMPGGVAAFDFDNDGLTDLYFTNGAELPSLKKTSLKYWNRLYRNLGSLRFEDVTQKAGVAGEGYSMGAAAADYDNDGHADLFVAGVRKQMLFHNRGDGTFEEVSARAGIGQGEWSVGGAWLDFDADGLLDLFVVNYLDWRPEEEPYCGDQAKNFRVYCPPDRYRGSANLLYRNLGHGKFADVSEASGIAAHRGKGMSAAVADLDADGWPDIFVANDRLPHFLFRNRGGQRFDEVALESGAALLDDGAPVSGMGSDFRDYDGDGRPDIVVTALAGETFPLFVNQGGGFFRDRTSGSRLSILTHARSGWGAGLVDFNNDGWKDLFTANAHVTDNIEAFSIYKYKLPNSVFANRGDGTFVDASASLASAAAHRGAAFADFDNDGRMDVAVSALDAPAGLWHNVSPGGGNWIVLKLEGSESNRDGLGASVSLAGQSNHMTSAGSYASSSHFGVHFGLGALKEIERIQIRWPRSTVQVLENVPANRVLRVREPSYMR